MRLTDVATASLYTGRPKGAIYRWAREGRIRVYGSRRGHRLYDLDELDAYVPGVSAGAFPPPPGNRSQDGAQ